jgi:hypothetical protein
MSENSEIEMDKDARELLILQAVRALLGEEKAQAMMVDMQRSNARLAIDIMSEAQARYDKFTLETKEDIKKAQVAVSLSSIKLRIKLLTKRGPKGLFLLFFIGIPKSILVSFPRWLNRIIFK